MSKINLTITGCMGRMGQQLIRSANKDKSVKIAKVDTELNLADLMTKNLSKEQVADHLQRMDMRHSSGRAEAALELKLVVKDKADRKLEHERNVINKRAKNEEKKRLIKVKGSIGRITKMSQEKSQSHHHQNESHQIESHQGKCKRVYYVEAL